MSIQRVLVVGGTGMLGLPVARRLLADGFLVRLLVRDLQRARQRCGDLFEYVQGDVTNEQELRAALAGCDAVHISLQGRSPAEFAAVEHQGTARIARLSAELGLQQISYLSGALVAADTVGVPQQRAKFLAEQAIRESGVAYSIFKPTYFMESLPLSVQGERATVMGRSDQRFRLVAAEDFAILVSKALRTPEAKNRDFFVYGPEALTMEEAMRLYCQIVTPQSKLSVTPLWMLGLIDRLFLGGQLRSVLQLTKLNQRLGEIGDARPTTAILGVASITLEQWCRQQALSPAGELAGVAVV